MFKLKNKRFIFIFLVIIIFSGTASALDVNISQELPYVDIKYKNNIIRIQRNQDVNHVLKGSFTKTSRKCPPFCIHPMKVAPGVETVGELELIDFLRYEVANNKGVLIDARTPAWHKKGTIPGSINIPFTVFANDPTDEELINAMKKLGVKQKTTSSDSDTFWSWTSFNSKDKNKNWDFSNAKNLVLWCNGIWCGQSPRAIKSLISHGYPANKIKYYRGGMQSWLILGLTVVKPE